MEAIEAEENQGKFFFILSSVKKSLRLLESVIGHQKLEVTKV